MIATVETVHMPVPQRGNLRWKCKHCGYGMGFKGVTSIYMLKAAEAITLMTFGYDGAALHALVHRCGADVDIEPLRSKPEWS